MTDSLEFWVPQAITLFLFLWSEYLGMSKTNKSNAIIQLLMCALTPKEDPPVDQSPPIILVPPPSPK